MYNSGNIPEDLSKSIFIALPRKPGATECELHKSCECCTQSYTAYFNAMDEE